ncbi:T9SS type A sorting domain-containing protein [Flavobacterium sp. Fl-77]|uniref:T9SS type A sorting domain-containing protein n=1 Tax=Flavobacterium flavipigmentatum TaxID=2893884 RepID=A0AAJ2W0I2_9FLAO|nr:MULTISPECIES: T9SS type A sorting domain-containing protein [unclassified Flavobacterium]MDX6181826.1 T9SS type A sorting domain-containing protein [Flavobacterium sp. Fl-33]MDX6185140.1 T9SS type A sorting domain-containing protein [Flavobacterium sp. Fl-77]UFH37247.1 T9SS type A sorting domain-containing protein [Flavobacterium sp. F-70]
MKKMLKLSLLCALLFTGTSTFAIDGNGDLALHVIRNNDGKLISFALNNITKAHLSIYDQDGTLIYSENASGKDGILRTFSLEEFPEGTYLLEIENNEKIIKHEIVVNNDISTLSTKAISAVYKAGSSAKNVSVAVR